MSQTNSIPDTISISQVMLLAFLDVSVAFETVDHDILLTTLSTSYGVVAQSLYWLHSVLEELTMMVAIAINNSVLAVTFSVLQGSVLVLFFYVHGIWPICFWSQSSSDLIFHLSDKMTCVSKKQTI